MKALLVGIFMGLLVLSPVQAVFADVWVNGYTKSNGTYVKGHYRSSPDSSPYNNWSFPGNINPYTGVTAGGSVNSYLNKYGSGSTYYQSTYYVPSYFQSTYYKSTYYQSTYYVPAYSSTYVPSSYSYLGSASTYEEVPHGYKSLGILYCDTDYYEKNDKCVKVPKNAYTIGDTIFCNSGYQKKGDRCLKPKNASYIGTTLYCDDGFYILGSSCVSMDKICKADFGKFSVSTSNDLCTCKDGYKWNNKNIDKATKCIKDKTKSSN